MSMEYQTTIGTGIGTALSKPQPKFTLRIPTQEQYAYIEVECHSSAEEAIKLYHEITDMYWASEKKRQSDSDPGVQVSTLK